MRREGSWESVLDQQISHCTQYWVIIRFASECEDALTPALSQGERGLVHSCTVALGGHGFDPLLFAEASPLVQAAR